MNELRPECRRLAAELRTLRTRAGLSMAALAAESVYSKSSWERYLNAKALPPWSAVGALCALANEPEPKLRVLWEQAESAWSGRAETVETAKPAPSALPGDQARQSDPASAASDQPSGPEHAAWSVTEDAGPRPRRRPRSALLILASVAVVAAMTAGAAYEMHGGPSTPPTTAFHIGCSGRSCQGGDPGTMLCGVQPATLGSWQSTTGAGLEIRYNQLCLAAWARVWNSQIGDVLSITAPGEPTTTVRVPDQASAENFEFTPMVWVDAKSSVLKVCLTTPANPKPECFTAQSP